ncbi:gypsy retrotransposon integrase-like protein 1 [Plakobranchus ocellatus]|uniref:Gypsy retrotransposon integrase-like protein 1 n=1 Tax=Plakobranchus ocellatus TaxID=259542 RepID=A0AAV4DBL7_9GAST|nr:gypsy retrotransposon integrase-like protein 1 [Plakobranchus ocellatus]
MESVYLPSNRSCLISLIQGRCYVWPVGINYPVSSLTRSQFAKYSVRGRQMIQDCREARVPDDKLLEWVESKVQADLDVQEKKLRAEESKLARAKELAEAEEKKLKAQTAALEAKKLLDVTAGTPTPHPNYAKPKLPPLTEFSQPCDAEFVAYIKDHSPTSLSDLKTQATSYLDARPSKSFIKDSATSFAGESVRPTARSDSRRPSSHSYRSPTHRRVNTPSLGRHTSHTSSGHRPPTHGVHSFGKSIRPFLTSKDNPRSASHQRNSTGAGSVKPPSDGACYYCGKKGHYIRDCRRRQADLSREAHVVCSQQYNCCIAGAKFNRDGRLNIEPASLFGSVDCPVPSACDVTRAQARQTIDNDSQNNMVPSYDPSTQSQLIPTPLNCVPLTDVGSRQKVEPTLKDWFNKVGAPPVGGVYFTITKGKLVRHYQRAGSDIIYTTIAVPESLRQLVLQCAHDNCLSGHSGLKKTLSNVQAYFSWPGLSNDVRCYTRSCHVCQVRPRVRSDRPAPFQPVTLVEIPFQRVIIDIVGPLPVSQNRYEYILTLVDLSTRWAEGVPLRHISAMDVAQSLFDLFCRLGFPCEIQSDRGQQFMSQILREFNSLTNIKHFLSSPYHPQTNGVVERFHSTLKGMLRKLAFDSPSNWCQYLNAAHFAYRCQVHTSTGYSPFFLLYGCSPRDPVEVLHDFMSNSDLSPETSLQNQFVIDFHNKLKAGCQLGASALKESADKSREHQSLNPRVKTFAVDEQVLVLLPSSNNKLSLTLQGPFNISKKLSPVVYIVDFGHRVSPLHVNLLRKYHRDTPYQIKQPTSTVSAENTTAKANAASHQPTAFEPALLPFAHASMKFDPLIFPFGSEDIKMPPETSPSMTAEDDITATAYVSTVTEESVTEFGSSIPTPSLSHDETLRVNINPCLDSAKVQ